MNISCLKMMTSSTNLWFFSQFLSMELSKEKGHIANQISFHQNMNHWVHHPPDVTNVVQLCGKKRE